MLFSVLAFLVLCPVVLGAIYESYDSLPRKDFHYIIVGGGTAGNVLANRLTEDLNASVLVLEAGESTADVLLSQVPFFSPRAIKSSLDWNFTTTEQPGLNRRSIPYPRGYGLGGSSAINSMFYTRGSSQDYDRYARISGDPGWGWDALRPYIRKNERFLTPADHHNATGKFNPKVHGFNGVTSVSLPEYPRATDDRVIQTTMDHASEFPFNLDYNSGYQLGIGWAPLTIGNGTRSSSQTSYLGPEFIDRPNLHVLIRARVTRILQSKNNNASPYLPSFIAIILSAGSIGTPHILLHSGIALGIASIVHLPDVGKNLSDHVLWDIPFIATDPNTIDNIYYRNTTFQAEVLAEWQANRTGFLTAGSANQLAFLRIPDTAKVLNEEPSAGNETAHYELAFLNGLVNGPTNAGNFFVVVSSLLCPLSRGDVTINSLNPLDPPLIDPNYLSHPQDLAVIKYAIESVKRFVNTTAWEGYILEMATNTTDDDIKSRASSVYHPVGTASMSPVGADWGVVNPDLTMKGAMGVRIVDASVLPFVPAGHTMAPVYAFAERAADLIKASSTKNSGK
ncbi:aryl-alcohol oxidase precursor [Desarmillaria tabescens]|uniref:Aryl-alcohol oxidase n=1 Tax=Armillaria tabescens TaxID=1929756 RepID=A0AA39JCE8_ARMTA|nr:aryl-alcohol oxidase precursor [Desarmillaria tabescens]KAK0439241.1 aryl-alcohol oxidase precursor [Desarmillaria tabescens]